VTFNTVSDPEDLKKLNSDDDSNLSDEVCPQGLSDMGNNATQTPKTTNARRIHRQTKRKDLEKVAQSEKCKNIF
jgi:hypothetical protein